jgi:hypothetical protein
MYRLRGTANSNPVGAVSPEFGFLQLVSWAYVTIVENGEPNLRCVLRHFSGQRLDNKRVGEIRDTIVCLRTFLQHSLAYGSDHDRVTLNKACSWFEITIGRRQPERNDFEACIRGLLLECHALIDDLLQFLRNVGRDKFRDIVIQQWVDARERTWPRHKFDAIVARVLHDLGRSDLKVEVVCSQNLKEMNDVLAASASLDDREAMLARFVEQRICQRYPLPLPVSARDLIALGVPPGPQIREILCTLLERFESGLHDRNELLGIAMTLYCPSAEA